MITQTRYTAETDPRPVSDPQLRFLGDLFTKKGVSAFDYVRPRSVTEAKELISHLIALPNYHAPIVVDDNQAEYDLAVSEVLADYQTEVATARGELITEPGMYSLNGKIYKATPKRSTTGLNVKMATPEGFVYVGGPYSIRGAVALSIEEAAAYGTLYGFCACCGKLLTDELSIAQGVGPVCIKKFF